MEFKYVIIGGGLAAGRACYGIRRVDESGSIAVVCDEPLLPYERPALSKGYLTGKDDQAHLLFRDAAFYDENHITVLSGVRAMHLDAQTHAVRLDDGRTLQYQKLLLATGGRARRLPVPGADLPSVFTLRTVQDADAIRAAAMPGARALVIGGSFIGAEVSASLAQLGLHVTTVFLEERLLARVLPERLGGWLEQRYQREGVRLIRNTGVNALRGAERVQQAELSNGETVDVDLVVMGVGVRLNTELAREAGLALDEAGAVLVDTTLRSSAADIYAAGDIAAWPDAVFGRRLRVEHWDAARNQGFRAGRNMAGEAKRYDVLPYFFSDLFDLSLEVWGYLEGWERVVWRGSPESGHVAAYYFAADRLCGVLAMGRPEAERKPMQALVQARPTYQGVAERLADEATDLATLLPAT